jgi:hypothetical protein
VTVAADLAGDLAVGSGSDLDELRLGWWKGIDAREEVARNGLNVAVAEETARKEFGGMGRDGFERGSH